MRGLPVDDDAPFRGRDHARDQLAQGGFARAVLADERMNFTGKQVEIGALQGGDAAIALGHAFERE